MTAKILDFDAHRLRRLAPRTIDVPALRYSLTRTIDVPALRYSLTRTMRKAARRIEQLVRDRDLSLSAATWRVWRDHPRLQAWQMMAARDWAGWRLQRRA